MTWEIVVGIIALIGVFGSVGTWSLKMGRTLATLETTIKSLRESIDIFRGEYMKAQDKTDKRIDKAEERIEDHETRLSILEHDKSNS